MKQFATDQFKNGNKDQVFGKKSNESYDCGWIDDQSGDSSPLRLFQLDLSTIDLTNFNIEGVVLGYVWSEDHGEFIINDGFQINGADVDSIAFNQWNPTLRQGYALKINDYPTYKKYASIGNNLKLVVNMNEGAEITFYGYKPNAAQDNEIHTSTGTLIFNIVDMQLIKSDYEDEQHETHHIEEIVLTLSPVQNFINDEENNTVYRPVFVSNTFDIEIPVDFTVIE